MDLRGEPGPAEHARSIIAAASSLTVTTASWYARLEGRHAVDGLGHLTLDLPAGDGGLPDGPVTATAELTDIAPVAMRRRTRARLTLAGRLLESRSDRADPPAGSRVVRFVPVTARLTDYLLPRTVDIDARALGAARPDPLAPDEATLLCHLADAHADLLLRLVRLLPAPRRHGVRTVLPLRLDRYGLVLRLEYPGREHNARIAFRTPLRSARDAPGRMLELLTRHPAG